MTRVSFNKGWTVKPKVSIFAQLGGHGGDAPDPVTLPHDAMIDRPRSPENPGKSAYYPDGVFEYVKSFEVPEEYRGQRVSVEFQGVYRDAMVYVNGVFAAQRPFGYSTFVVPLDAYLKYGETNTIRVEARTHDDSRWYTGAGIYRDTSLVVNELVHIAANGLRVTTPDIEPERAVVEIAVALTNEGITTETVTVETELRDAQGTVVARGSSPVTMRGGASATTRHRVYVAEPQLWSVDEPYLYSVLATVRDIADTVDVEQTTFGIRSLKLDPHRGLRINGEIVKLRGACIHHDNGILGAAAIGRAEERRIELLKAAGFNAIRSSHNPVSQAMLDACDRIGMLVMDETFDVWAEGKSSFDYSLSFPEWWERDIEAFVAKDFNHPSVIFYSTGNEILEAGDPLGSELGRRLAEKVRSLDSTRFVTNGINGFVATLADIAAMMKDQIEEAQAGSGGVNDVMSSIEDFMNQVSVSPLVTEKTAESFSVLDVAGMNYSDGRYVMDRDLFPNRVIVGTETYPRHIDVNWRLVEENPHVIGDFTWTGWDYLGEVGIGRLHYADAVGDSPAQFEAPFPWRTAWAGDIDITGHRRPASYYRETVFGLRHEPYIAVQRPENYGREYTVGQWSWTDSISSWAWPVDSGSSIKVEVYSDADEVELELNGRSIGRLPAGREHSFRAEFDTTYQPGELVAIAYIDGVERARTSIRSAGDARQLSVVPDRTELIADDTDLSFIAIELRDSEGVLVTGDDRVVSVNVDGAGVLQGLGSGRPDSEEQFHSECFTTFDGRLLAIVRPTATGVIEVTVAAEGIETTTVTLEVLGEAAVVPELGGVVA